MTGVIPIPELGAVVVTYRSAALLEGCFAGLRPLLEPGALAVVDSCSPDDTLERAGSLWPGGRMLRMEQNRGYAAGVNAGLRLLDRAFLLVLNPDTVIEPAGVRRALEWLRSHPDFGMLGPQLISPDGRNEDVRYREPFLRGMLRTYCLRDPRQPPPIGEVDSVLEAQGIVGAAMLVRREALNRVGPMDEDFFLYCEEVDWCTRFRQAGYRIGTLPEWRLTHLGGASTATLAVHIRVLAHRSLYLYFLKHGGQGRAELFRLVLVLSAPIEVGVSLLNGLIGRVPWAEVGRRIASHLQAIWSPLPQRPSC